LNANNAYGLDFGVYDRMYCNDGWRRWRINLPAQGRLPKGPDQDRKWMQGVNVDVNSKIEDQLKSHDILLYMKGTPDFPQCGFSGQTVAALNAIGKPFSFVNIFEDQEIREGLKAYSNWPTFPQLYVKGELVGGCDIIVEMYHSGELKELLDS
jgi:monothiol glutaredoxin